MIRVSPSPEKTRRNRRWSDVALPLGLGACAALLVAGLLAALPHVAPIIGLSVAVIGGIAIGWAGHQRRERARNVARPDAWLGALPAGFRILHDVDLPGMTLDHLVIAPTGVFAIVTPSQKGIVQTTAEGLTVDGRRLLRDPRRQAQAAAAVVRDLLQREFGARVRVSAVVCFPRANVIGRTTNAETPVLGWLPLLAWLRRGPKSLPASTRARIRKILVRGTARGTHPRIRLVGGAAANTTPR